MSSARTQPDRGAHSEVLLDLLGQLVARPEAMLYLERFSQLQQHRSLLIRVEGQVLIEQIDDLSAAVAFLFRLGLRPIVLTDLTDILGSIRGQTGSADKAGQDVVHESDMTQLRPLAYQRIAGLIEALEAKGVEARALQNGVFDCDWSHANRLDFRGQLRHIQTTLIQSEVDQGRVVVLGSLGETSSGQVLVLNTDQLLVSLAACLESFKIVWLTPEGPLRDQNEAAISAISLTSDYDYLVVQSLVRDEDRARTGVVYRILEGLDPSASVALTRAGHLIRELFSHVGSGTLVRKGEPMLFHDRPDLTHLKALPDLLERSFSRELRSGWLEQQDIIGLLMADSARAAALIIRGHQGVPYLDKIMVTPEARGEGLGAALWQSLRGRFPAMYWRSRVNNPINSWYFRRAQTAHRLGRWVVFTQGVSDFGVLSGLMSDAAQRDSGWA